MFERLRTGGNRDNREGQPLRLVLPPFPLLPPVECFAEELEQEETETTEKDNRYGWFSLRFLCCLLLKISYRALNRR
jgi:hypothetical protein